MTLKSNRFILLFCLSGILGGILMLAGDWLFYFSISSGKDFHSFEVMRRMSDTRLIAGGVVGPLGAILYSLGSFSLYFAFKDINKMLALVISSLMVIMFINGAAYHTLFTTYGFIYKINDPLIFAVLKHQLDSLSSVLYSIEMIAAIPATLIFYFLVLLRKTLYPKWIVFIFPTTLSLIEDVAQIIPYPFGGVIAGSWINGWFIIFFCASAYFIHRSKSISETMFQNRPAPTPAPPQRKQT
jgi:hypothetical protein